MPIPDSIRAMHPTLAALAWLTPGLLLAAVLVPTATMLRSRQGWVQFALPLLAGADLAAFFLLFSPGLPRQTPYATLALWAALAAGCIALMRLGPPRIRPFMAIAALSLVPILPAALLSAGVTLPGAAIALALWPAAAAVRACCCLGATLAQPRWPLPAPAAGAQSAAAPSLAAHGEWQAALDAHRQASSLLAHELRAPLATLDAAAQALALAASEDDSHAQTRLARMRRAVRRVAELTDNFLGSGKLGERLLQPRNETIDLAALAHDVAATMQADAAHLLRVEAGGPVMAWADSTLCAEVLRNLLHNAVKYSPADQPIVLRAHADTGRGQVCLSVSDHGPGIGQAERERIFEPYYRRTIHRETKGTGVGLYLAREMCRRQGGDLVLARSDARGSIFEMTFQAANT